MRKMRERKAQMKIQQMAFMLMAVTLFFVLAGMFVLVIRFSNLRKSAQELEEKEAMLLVTKLANSPEFSCGDAFTAKTNCIDADKVMALKENIERYDDFWGIEYIEIRKIYPDNRDIPCTKDNYDKCGVIEVLSNKDLNLLPSVSNFVSLCRKESGDFIIYDKCELAKLIISSEN
jgi:hypothetical protein